MYTLPWHARPPPLQSLLILIVIVLLNIIINVMTTVHGRHLFLLNRNPIQLLLHRDIIIIFIYGRSVAQRHCAGSPKRMIIGRQTH